MATTALLSGIERYLTAQREYERGYAAGNAEALARSVEKARGELVHADGAKDVKALRVLAAVDAADHPAIDAAASVARATGGVVAIVHVIAPSVRDMAAAVRVYENDPAKVRRDEAVKMLEEGQARITPDVRSEWILREGDPVAEIVEAARQWAADIIVIGTRNRAPLTQFFLGSVSSAVVRLARCPVLLTHEEMREAERLPRKGRVVASPRRLGTLHRHIA